MEFRPGTQKHVQGKLEFSLVKKPFSDGADASGSKVAAAITTTAVEADSKISKKGNLGERDGGFAFQTKRIGEHNVAVKAAEIRAQTKASLAVGRQANGLGDGAFGGETPGGVGKGEVDTPGITDGSGIGEGGLRTVDVASNFGGTSLVHHDLLIRVKGAKCFDEVGRQISCPVLSP